MTDKIFRIQSIEKIGNRVEAEILHEGKTSTIFFECDDPALVPSPEALLAVTLMPAMRAGAELQMGSEISKRILDSITTLQDIHHTWYPDIFQHIPVTEATPVERLNPEAQRVGLFFSLGVDSWYTLLKHQQEIDLVLLPIAHVEELDAEPLDILQGVRMLAEQVPPRSEDREGGRRGGSCPDHPDRSQAVE